MAHLQATEKQVYQREGWVVPQWRLPAPRVDAMRAALDRLIADNPGIRPEKLVSAHIQGKNAERVRAKAHDTAAAGQEKTRSSAGATSR